MKISVIVPVWNEEKSIQKVIEHIQLNDSENLIGEILVIDGQSSDNTINNAENSGAIVYQSPKKGRAAQMNFGASKAQFPILFFLHADSLPPLNFSSLITSSVLNGFSGGCFRLKFDLDHHFLTLVSWFTRFDNNSCRGGDQGLFVKKDIFDRFGGFNEHYKICEDHEIIKNIKAEGKFGILKDYVVTSARRYNENGIYRLQLIFIYIKYLYYWRRRSPEQILPIYRKYVR